MVDSTVAETTRLLVAIGTIPSQSKSVRSFTDLEKP